MEIHGQQIHEPQNTMSWVAHLLFQQDLRISCRCTTNTNMLTAPRPSFLTANLSTVYGISICQESKVAARPNSRAVPEHGPTLTGPTPNLKLRASHEPKENKFYQTAIAIRMNSLKRYIFWVSWFFCQCCVFFLFDSWAFKTIMFF